MRHLNTQHKKSKRVDDLRSKHESQTLFLGKFNVTRKMGKDNLNRISYLSDGSYHPAQLQNSPEEKRPTLEVFVKPESVSVISQK